MASIFSKIISGEIPCHKVHEDEKFLAFLDVNPLQKGHTLVVPKVEVDYIFDLQDELLSEMILFSKSVSKKIKSNFDCKKIGVAVVGLEVPHAHIHLIPINTMKDMDFTGPKLILTYEELRAIAEKLRN